MNRPADGGLGDHRPNGPPHTHTHTQPTVCVCSILFFEMLGSYTILVIAPTLGRWLAPSWMLPESRLCSCIMHIKLFSNIKHHRILVISSIIAWGRLNRGSAVAAIVSPQFDTASLTLDHFCFLPLAIPSVFSDCLSIALNMIGTQYVVHLSQCQS